VTGLVLELQAEALDRSTPVSDLLRKALAVSKKLGVTQIEEWIGRELNGYPLAADLPAYREIHGQIKIWNPYHGWQPLHFGDADMGQKLSSRKIMQPVGELDSLNTDKGGLQVSFPEHIKNRLMSGMEVALEPTLHVPSSEVVGILDAVRNMILAWTLELEQNGILGEGLTFSRDEKVAASQITYQITNNIGSMSNSQLQQASPAASQAFAITNDLEALCNVLNELKSKRHELGLGEPDLCEMAAEIEIILSQSSSPKPKPSILRESLKSIRTILEAAAGNALASGFLIELGRFG
jgi:AbiTii